MYVQYQYISTVQCYKVQPCVDFLLSEGGDVGISVYLLTGYLGSGKTSLLKNWLQQPEFKDAALIINELGEVGLDQHLLQAAVEPKSPDQSATLIANACVCCTGLPGLEQAMEDLFWARLHRRIPKFNCLVIETTGLAQAGPIIQAMRANELISQRFTLAAVITCISAVTVTQVLNAFDEAKDQLRFASVIAVTKTDLLTEENLASSLTTIELELRQHNPNAAILHSSRASLSVGEIFAAHSACDDVASHETENHHHSHATQAYWWLIKQQVDEDILLADIHQLLATHGSQISRLKGIVATNRGIRHIELSPFDTELAISDYVPNSDTKFGLTIISSAMLTLKTF
jgi:G3E family GTPase